MKARGDGGTMRVRIFEGACWSDARAVGDFVFELAPLPGHKLVLAGDGGWLAGVIRDVVHRIGDAAAPADLALLVDRLVASKDQSELPLSTLDQLGGGARESIGAAAVPKPSPWRP